LDPQHFGLLDPDPQKYVDLRAEYQPKLQKLLQMFLSLNGFSSCCIKISGKSMKICSKNSSFVKNSVNLEINVHDLPPHFGFLGSDPFFSSRDPESGSGSPSKLNGY